MLDSSEVLERLFEKDPTLWKDGSPEDQAVIGTSLGWIDLVERMRPELPGLKSFADELREEFETVVLLGMGGSSLCPEVYRRVFGRIEGWPELIVLDSVVPEAVREVESLIDPSRTLFVVASKSGSTIEPMSLFKRFRGLLEERGLDSGKHFVAVTDPGSPLEGLAKESGFRGTFVNFSDIGGRYSALSFFGMVPAALAGYDVEALLDRAERGFRACAPDIAIEANPAWMLGAVAGGSANAEIDKLTLILPDSLSSVGLWIEQLVAESTGKEGKGVVPIAGEPALDVSHYGDDRIFVVTRFTSDSGADDWLEEVRSTHSVMELDIGDDHDVTWLFVVWELATALMGIYLDINPFDQPDVEEAKKQAKRALGEPPETESSSIDDVADLAKTLKTGDYLALLVYGRETEERNETIHDLRRRIGERFEIATTAGYGPRYLHSTGQLHKGGPEGSLFIIVSENDDDEMPVHGESYTLNRLAIAQAVGDRRALEAAGRRVVHLHGPAIDETLETLRRWLEAAG
ncbi:MAG: glucose-6-phosphate isomerase [Thermoanaerobaculia bacterium]|nr:glucose-6-phosphate isomerase [Thermoanaerobaculia bacterium]